MRMFIYKCIVVFIGIYLTYNFTIGKKLINTSRKWCISFNGSRERTSKTVNKKRNKIHWIMKIF